MHRTNIARSWVVLGWITTVLACMCAAAALAADVKGQLVLGTYQPPPSAKAPRPAFNWELDNGVKEVLRDRVSAPRELAIVLVGAGESKVSDRMEVAISGGTLLPSTLVVRAGTTLRIRNDDEIGHELYAEGMDGGFSAEATSPKAIRSVRLDKPGTWPLRDKLVPHARAQLHVLADLIAVAKVEANGNFAFTDVAPGKYKLKVLHGANQVAEKDIEVGDKALTIDPFALSAEAPAKASP